MWVVQDTEAIEPKFFNYYDKSRGSQPFLVMIDHGIAESLMIVVDEEVEQPLMIMVNEG